MRGYKHIHVLNSVCSQTNIFLLKDICLMFLKFEMCIMRTIFFLNFVEEYVKNILTLYLKHRKIRTALHSSETTNTMFEVNMFLNICISG